MKGRASGLGFLFFVFFTGERFFVFPPLLLSILFFYLTCSTLRCGALPLSVLVSLPCQEDEEEPSISEEEEGRSTTLKFFL